MMEYMDQTAEMKIPFELKSLCGRVRAELSAESVWIGTTVYPDCPVWRVWYDGRPMIDTSTVGLMTEAGPLAYAMRLVKVSRHRPQTGIGPARSVIARFAARDGRELEVTLRVTELSAFCGVREIAKTRDRKAGDRLAGQGLSITRFPEGSVLLGMGETPNAEGERPQVRFAPSGKVIAWWRHGLEQHAVFFDRPGDLAVRRFGVLPQVASLPVADGRAGCGHLFLTVPFTKAELPAPVFGEGLTPAYRAAFELALGRNEASDDFWVMRGEPGEFAVVARRCGRVWRVGGLVSEPMTLTVRFEDLWLRMSPELRVLHYTVEILRDPIRDEAGDHIEESFAAQAPDVRVALDAAKNGGFLLTFRPEV